MRLLLKVLLCGAVAFGLASAAVAATINVDFDARGMSDPYTGTAVAPDAGTYWNVFVPGNPSDPIASGALTASDGTTATTTTVTIGQYSADYNNASAAFAAGLLDDYQYATGADRFVFSINGLVAGGGYDLWIYNKNGAANSAHAQYTVGGVTKEVTNSVAGNSAFVEGNNYLHFTGLIADGTGMISGTALGIGSGGGNNIAFNGFQIATSIPEPTTLVCSVTGLIGLLAYAWRRRK